MSRLGKKPIALPDGVTVEVANGNLVKAKGPKGEQAVQVHPDLIIKVEDGEVEISRPTEQKRHKSMHGLYRTLIFNCIEGVSKGYEKHLELIGVGYKASVQGKVLEMSLGYSHEIFFQVPEEINVTAVTEKGKNPKITVEGINKELVGQVAAKLKSLRPPEPYKGKGIRFVGEHIRRKAGKAAAK